ncbi:hypothetical protein AGMMS49975_24600 [Clostridia bacterium]|nr:hypothetical protein AGMMS49975_24600 [Clostridia bacterium]
MNISIFGEQWEITLGVDPKGRRDLEGTQGLCICHERKIIIVDLLKLPEWADSSEYSRKEGEKEILRHEILHAFFAECGLWGSSLSVCAWALNEEMVDWFALNAPKIYRAYQEAGAM